jgi:integrase
VAASDFTSPHFCVRSQTTAWIGRVVSHKERIMTSLRQRMLDDMRIRNLSSETQTSYVNHVARFARYFRQSPEHLGPEDIRAYQLHLINDRHLAPTSVAGAVAALRFLYQTTLKQDWAVDAIASPKRGDRLPVVLSPEEVVRFLSSDVADQKHRVILTTCYAPVCVSAKRCIFRSATSTRPAFNRVVISQSSGARAHVASGLSRNRRVI